MKLGDIVGLIGKLPRFVIREIMPDGKHAVCERVLYVGNGTFVALPSTSYSSYVLALADLEKPRAPARLRPQCGKT
jgi:hypothetical protein